MNAIYTLLAVVSTFTPMFSAVSTVQNNSITDGCGMSPKMASLIKKYSTRPDYQPCFPILVGGEGRLLSEDFQLGWNAGYFAGQRDLMQGSYDPQKVVKEAASEWSRGFSSGYASVIQLRP